MSPVTAVGLATALAAGTSVAANTVGTESHPVSAESTASTLPPVTPSCTYYLGVAGGPYMGCEVTASGVVELPYSRSGPLYVHAAGQPGAWKSSKGGGGGRAQTLIHWDESDDLYVYMTFVEKAEVADRYAGGSATVVTTTPIEDSSIDDVIVIAGGGGAEGRRLNPQLDDTCGGGNGGPGGFVDAERENSGASGPGTSPAHASGGNSNKGDSCGAYPHFGEQPKPGNAGIGGSQDAGGGPGRPRDGKDGIGGQGGSSNGWIQPWRDADGNAVVADSSHPAPPTGYTGGAGGGWNTHESAGGGGGYGGGGGGARAYGGAGGGSYAAAPTGVWNAESDPRWVLKLPDWDKPNRDPASVWFFYHYQA
ncbi:MAG: hypothetical protein AAGF73_08250 [Actinomycetota bacterium]